MISSDLDRRWWLGSDSATLGSLLQEEAEERSVVLAHEVDIGCAPRDPKPTEQPGCFA